MRDYGTLLTFGDRYAELSGAHYVNVYPAWTGGHRAGSAYGALFHKPRREWRRDDANDGVLYRLHIRWKRAGE